MSMKRRDGYIAAISRKHITMTTLKSQWICSKHIVYIVFQSSFHRPAVHHHGVRNDKHHETRGHRIRGAYTYALCPRSRANSSIVKPRDLLDRENLTAYIYIYTCNSIIYGGYVV